MEYPRGTITLILLFLQVSPHLLTPLGPDPADPSRILLRKLVKVSESTYAFEETRITPDEKGPTVHSQMYRIGGYDKKEYLDGKEIQIRSLYKPVPNVMGFSLFYKTMENKKNHLSIVENTLSKASGTTWSDWFKDMKDRRDMSNYIKKRW